jgi:hypothetical protein
MFSQLSSQFGNLDVFSELEFEIVGLEARVTSCFSMSVNIFTDDSSKGKLGDVIEGDEEN